MAAAVFREAGVVGEGLGADADGLLLMGVGSAGGSGSPSFTKSFRSAVPARAGLGSSSRARVVL